MRKSQKDVNLCFIPLEGFFKYYMLVTAFTFIWDRTGAHKEMWRKSVSRDNSLVFPGFARGEHQLLLWKKP